LQVTNLHVNTFELASGASEKGYLGSLQGRVSETTIQEALKGISDDVKAEHAKHAAVMAETREQMQRLEKQVAVMMAKVDGFNHSGGGGGEVHDVGALLHAFKETSDKIQTEAVKVKEDLEKKKSETLGDKRKQDKAIEKVASTLESTVEKHKGSSWSSLLILLVAVGICGSLYQKMRSYEKKHHL